MCRALCDVLPGHRHDQELWQEDMWHKNHMGVTCIVTGGGGGISSEAGHLEACFRQGLLFCCRLALGKASRDSQVPRRTIHIEALGGNGPGLGASFSRQLIALPLVVRRWFALAGIPPQARLREVGRYFLGCRGFGLQDPDSSLVLSP